MTLRINTGGVLSPDEVIGRDALIARIWETLEVQSVELNAERRMGKTSILTKMKAEPVRDFVPIYRDLENINTPEEFLECIVQDLHEWLTAKQKTERFLKSAWQTLGGTEVAGKFKIPNAPALHWKSSLQMLLSEINKNVVERVVFLWDEMPLMVQNIKRIRGENEAMEVLDTLRTIRHSPETKSVRMVFTGSIGLHHILTVLRNSGHANKPINDMSNILVPGLDRSDACQLAEALLDGIGVRDPESRKRAANEIAAATDCIPYYIHHLVKRVREHSGGVSRAIGDIDALRSEMLYDPQDLLDLKYYRERINTYYLQDRQYLAIAALDALANQEPLLFPNLLSRVKLQSSSTDDEALRDTLSLLERDHYIQRGADGYRFQRRFIRDAWKALRGIA